MTYRLNEYLLVPITEDRTFDDWDGIEEQPYVGYHERSSVVQSLYGDDPCGYPTRICDLPEGQWDFVCKGTEVDEVMAKLMVEKDMTVNPACFGGSFPYRDYDTCGGLVLPTKTALESFHSYLTAHSLTAASIAVLKLK